MKLKYKYRLASIWNAKKILNKTNLVFGKEWIYCILRVVSKFCNLGNEMLGDENEDTRLEVWKWNDDRL